MLPPIVSIVGKSNSGKTTLVEKLLPELVRRGYKVGTIKHHFHPDFDFDIEGKDSWRHKEAGAYQVIVSSPNKMALVRNAEYDAPVSEIREKYGRDLDIIMTEGYKRESFSKIEIFRKGVHETMLCENDDKLVALVTDADLNVNVPKFGLDDAKGIIDFVEEKFLKKKKTSKEGSVKLYVDGKDVTLKPFIQKTLKGMIKGYLEGLRDVENAGHIRVEITDETD